MSLQNKKIIIGISGGIAAYKTPELVRQFVKKGAEVKVIITKAAADFVSPLSLSVVSRNKVFMDFVEDFQWQNHVELGLWADVILIAPASANTLAKMANGICDNLLTGTYLSARCPVFIAPAMDVDMYLHSAIQHNLKKLTEFGHKIIQPDSGELASGLTGIGRMPEPEALVAEVEEYFGFKKTLTGKKVVVTAGPTREAIDPVRYISNHSSGKMGYAIAEEAYKRGADVTLIRGKGAQPFMNRFINVIEVDSSDEMNVASQKAFKKADIFIMAAAVADYKAASVSNKKLKKNDDALQLELVKTTDILAQLGKNKKSQLLIGFALETDNEIEHAKRKLRSKQLDFIVLNSLNDSGAGFAGDTNKIAIIDNGNKISEFPLKPKNEVAADILNFAENKLKSNTSKR